MKNRSTFLLTLLFIISISGVYAQSFTVNIPLTDNTDHHIQPIKINATRQIQIHVTNVSDTEEYTVSIDKSNMSQVFNWVSIEDNNSLIIPAGETKTFKLNVFISAGSSEGVYNMPLDFEAEDSGGNVHTFSYYTQVIIVDNSAPFSPTFDVSQSNENINFTNINGFDEFSNIYTLTNHSSLGYWGIKEFKIEIKDPNDNDKIIKSKLFYHDDGYNHYFSGLTPNKEYKSVVIVVDYVGLSNSTEKSTKTAPPIPTNLEYSNITYIDAVLNWSPSDGATGYDVFKKSNIERLNTSLITTNSFKIEDLDPETEYV